ncbi:MAG: hypothetical protein R3261_01540 [Alphaproteobacteria bacterium]|nr:hypothetical protein [Alphaproteobacteria bacterium]
MILPSQRAQEFFEVYKSLLQFVSLSAFGEDVESIEDYIDARDILFEDTNIVNEFITTAENLNESNYIILRNIQKGIRDTFIYLKTLKKHSLLLGTSSNSIYCVLGLTDPIEEMIPNRLAIVDTAILNLGNQIVCDGLISNRNVIIGPNMRKDINVQYKKARESNQLIAFIKNT